MATARAIITSGMQQARILGSGRSPSSAQAAEALDRLNDYIDGLVGFGGSQPLRDIRIDGDYEVESEWPGLRLLCTASAAITITLPDGLDEQYQPPDGFRLAVADVAGTAATYNITIVRSGWKIAGSTANATISTNSASRLYMFRADLCDWKLAGDLGLDDDLPFPAQFDGAFKAIVGRAEAARNGQAPSSEVLRMAERGEQMLRARYVKVQPLIHEGGVPVAELYPRPPAITCNWGAFDTARDPTAPT